MIILVHMVIHDVLKQVFGDFLTVNYADYQGEPSLQLVKGESLCTVLGGLWM